MTPIVIYQRPSQSTRTPEASCKWTAETVVDGRHYTASSRMAPANEIARQLIADGVNDCPMEVRTQGLRGALVWRSFHKAAEWYVSENRSRPVRSISWAEVEAKRLDAAQLNAVRKQAGAKPEVGHFRQPHRPSKSAICVGARGSCKPLYGV